MDKVLFICTGNYFRSRFSECYFSELAEREGLPWRGISRGFFPWMAPEGMSPDAKAALKELGVRDHNISQFKTKLSEKDLVDCRIAIALKETEHRPYMERYFPEWADKIQYWEAHDIDVQPARMSLIGMTQQVELLVRHLKAKAA